MTKEEIAALGNILGLLLSAGAIMLFAELRYRWSVWVSFQNSRWRRQEDRESFVKYLFMAWFVRTRRWYERKYPNEMKGLRKRGL